MAAFTYSHVTSSTFEVIWSRALSSSILKLASATFTKSLPRLGLMVATFLIESCWYFLLNYLSNSCGPKFLSFSCIQLINVTAVTRFVSSTHNSSFSFNSKVFQTLLASLANLVIRSLNSNFTKVESSSTASLAINSWIITSIQSYWKYFVTFFPSNCTCLIKTICMHLVILIASSFFYISDASLRAFASIMLVNMCLWLLATKIHHHITTIPEGENTLKVSLKKMLYTWRKLQIKKSKNFDKIYFDHASTAARMSARPLPFPYCRKNISYRLQPWDIKWQTERNLAHWRRYSTSGIGINR